MSLAIKLKDPNLKHVSDRAMSELLATLYIEPSLYFYSPDQWRAKQEYEVRRLPSSLLQPKDLVSRLTKTMSKHHMPFCSKQATLCSAHKLLNSRLIRFLLRLVADECTLYTNKYRHLRSKRKLQPTLKAWLERIDYITAMWLGEEEFRYVMKRKYRIPSMAPPQPDEYSKKQPRAKVPECVRSKCEACMLAVVGGSAQDLAVLRGSLKARQAYTIHEGSKKKMYTPRLLPIVEGWISMFPDQHQEEIYGCSDSLVEGINAMRRRVRRRRDKYVRKCYKQRLIPYPPPYDKVVLTEDGLPMPRQPKISRRTPISTYRAEMRAPATPTSAGYGYGYEYGYRYADGEIQVTVDEEGGENDDDVEDDYELEPGEEEGGKNEYWLQDYQNYVNGDDDGAKGGPAAASSSRRPPPRGSNIATSMAMEEGEQSDVESPTTPGIPGGFPEPKTPSSPVTGRRASAIRQDKHASWSSKVSSLHENSTAPPPTYLAAPPQARPASSVYSQNPGNSSKRDTVWPTLESMNRLSLMQRDSATPKPLKLRSDTAATPARLVKQVDRRTLAKLEGRPSSLTSSEGDAASCYEDMGWGGPRR